jgi:hypothetical protein
MTMGKWLTHNDMVKKGTSALKLLESESYKQKLENRELLELITDTIGFCILQKIPLRGHIENRDNLTSASDINNRNFGR